MKINKNNYEAYFLDYHENNLNPDERKELKAFLEAHPSLYEEFKAFEPVFFTPNPNETFINKSALKKSAIQSVNNINEENYDDYLIAELEYDLTGKEKQNLQLFLEKNPDLKVHRALYQKSKVEPDKGLIFLDKNSLKKEAPKGKAIFLSHSLRYAAAIAASLLIFVALFVNNRTPEQRISLAANDKPSVSLQTSIDKKSPIIEEPVVQHAGFAYSKTEVSNNLESKDIPEPIERIERKNPKIVDYQNRRFALATLENHQDLSFIYNSGEIEQNQIAANKPLDFFRKIINPEKVNEIANNFESMDAWDVADMGISGLNMITSNVNYDLVKDRNQEGKVTKIKFSANNFAFSRSFSEK